MQNKITLWTVHVSITCRNQINCNVQKKNHLAVIYTDNQSVSCGVILTKDEANYYNYTFESNVKLSAFDVRDGFVASLNTINGSEDYELVTSVSDWHK